MNNYERIKSMTVDEMAELIEKASCNYCSGDKNPNGCQHLSSCEEGVKQWLLSEVEDE